VGYGEEREQAVIELTYNWGVEHYDLGSGFGHIAIEVDDVYAACDEIKRRGGTVVREAGPMHGGTTVIAFVADPDGYRIELIAKNRRRGEANRADGYRAFINSEADFPISTLGDHEPI